MPKAKLMSSVEITEEPDGEQFKGASTRTASAQSSREPRSPNRVCGDKWSAGITEAQIVDAVEIDLLQPDC
jgi:hypothetical protein